MDKIVATFEHEGERYEVDDLGSGDFPDQDGVPQPDDFLRLFAKGWRP